MDIYQSLKAIVHFYNYMRDMTLQTERCEYTQENGYCITMRLID